MQFLGNIKLTVFFLALVVIVGGCSGGGSSNSKNSDNSVAQIQVNVKTDEVVLDDSKEYNLVSNSGSASYKSSDNNASSQNIDSNTSSSDVIMLLAPADQPVLLARKYSDDTEVDLSLDSTAEMLVLYQPRFTREPSNNPKELSNRIRTNPLFNDLKQSIKTAIDRGSPCPLDPGCNYEAASIASDLADSLNIDDLYLEN